MHVISTLTPFRRFPFGFGSVPAPSLITPYYGKDSERRAASSHSLTLALSLFLSRSFNAEFTAAQLSSPHSLPPLARLAAPVGAPLGARPACSHAYRKEGNPTGTLFEFVLGLLLIKVTKESVEVSNAAAVR